MAVIIIFIFIILLPLFILFYFLFFVVGFYLQLRMIYKGETVTYEYII
jgi:hypothetical protein